jgi:alpha-ketoglutarate-dependent taurine dioxygenase
MAVTRTKLAPRIGLEFVGLSGHHFVDRRVADDCLAALEESGVVIYREANIDDDDLVAFSRLLGEVVILPMGVEKGHPEISKITRDPSKSSLASYREGTFHWHIDGTSQAVPEKATLLAAREISDNGGGDTEFANTYLAYEALPQREKDELEGVRVLHSLTASQLLVHPNASDEERAVWDRAPKGEHPLVWTRRNGRKSLLLGATTEAVVGQSAEEGRALLDRLLEWSTQRRFVVHHRWHQGDLVVWDNTGLLHRALPYSETSSRLLHRTTLAGEEAVA